MATTSATATTAPNKAERTGTAVRPRPGSSAKRTPTTAGGGSPADAAASSGTAQNNGNRPATTYPSNQFVFSPGGLGQVNTDWNQSSARNLVTAFPDGTSNTIIFAESYVNCQSGGRIWTESNPGQGPSDFNGAWFHTTALPQFLPTAAACNPALLQGHSTSVILVGLGDGSSRSVTSAISQATWQSAILPDDGVPLGPDW